MFLTNEVLKNTSFSFVKNYYNRNNLRYTVFILLILLIIYITFLYFYKKYAAQKTFIKKRNLNKLKVILIILLLLIFITIVLYFIYYIYIYQKYLIEYEKSYQIIQKTQEDIISQYNNIEEIIYPYSKEKISNNYQAIYQLIKNLNNLRSEGKILSSTNEKYFNNIKKQQNIAIIQRENPELLNLKEKFFNYLKIKYLFLKEQKNYNQWAEIRENMNNYYQFNLKNYYPPRTIPLQNIINLNFLNYDRQKNTINIQNNLFSLTEIFQKGIYKALTFENSSIEYINLEKYHQVSIKFPNNINFILEIQQNNLTIQSIYIIFREKKYTYQLGEKNLNLISIEVL